MQSKFKSFLKDNFPYLLKDRCIICCSAGVDSVVLFHLMLSVNKNIIVAHCNFKLRGVESDKDEEFVMTLCEENSIKFYSKSFDIKKIKKINLFDFIDGNLGLFIVRLDDVMFHFLNGQKFKMNYISQ